MPLAPPPPQNVPDYSPGRLMRLAFVFAEVALIAVLLRKLDLQPSAFRRVFMLATVGFVINDLLPLRIRPAFFVGLSIATTFLALGGSPETRVLDITLGLTRTVTIVGAGLLLIAVCHLPIGFWKRAALLATAGLVIAGFRYGVVETGPLGITWIILAGMFMFRVMIYLYDVSTSPARPPPARSMAYFFLLPNACVPFFPVIDFKKFSTLYYNEPALVIYQRGVRWMALGVVQLLTYRFVNQLLVLKATEVSNGTDLLQFLITNVFLYLKVSGGFHLVIGLLLLFGFNLPVTNHNYFLAESFTDYWRRVNIYWKDFMLKVFYYPTYFRLKQLGGTLALVLATAWTFVVTWALHLYQTWWLKGAAAVTWPDSLFWLILGVLILLNSLWEMKRGRTRTLASSAHSVSTTGWLALRTAGTFACVCLLWSLWSSPSVGVWLSLWQHADMHTLLGAAVVVVVIMAAKVVEQAPMVRRPAAAPGRPAREPRFLRPAIVQCALPLLILCALALPRVQSRLDDPRLQPYFDALTTRDPITGGGTGYYENLTGVDPRDRELAETLTRERLPKTAVSDGADPRRRVDDLRYRELIPNTKAKAWFAHLDINRWGMRDRDYDLAKAPGTIRIAVLGTSQVMGYGVPQDRVFAKVLEERLNREYAAGRGGVRFEVLNFAVPGYTPLSQIDVLQKQARPLHPDIVLFVASWPDTGWLVYYLWRCVNEGVPVTHAYVQEALRKARVVRRTTLLRGMERLGPMEDGLTAWSYSEVVKECQAMGAQAVWTYLPVVQPEEPAGPGERAAVKLARYAAQAGFTAVGISATFDHLPVRDLLTHDPTDISAHWNFRGHALIAAKLYEQLTSHPSVSLAPPATGSVDGAAATGKSASKDN